MRRSSGSGQVEPLVACVAVFALCVGLSTYATAVGGYLVGLGNAEVAGGAGDRVTDRLRVDGSVRPERLSRAATAPAGYRLNATLRVEGRRWTVGPTPPDRAGYDRRHVAVRVEAGRVVPGSLAVEVWR
jgi:hypothetical protein